MTGERVDLEAVDALLAKATPGPWGWDTSGVWHVASGGPVLDFNALRKGNVVGIGRVGDSYPRGDNHPTENMQLIAEGRTLLEQMANELRALRAEVAALAGENETLVERIGKYVAGDIGIKELTVRDGVMNLTLATEITRDIAQCLATMLDESCDKPAENYVEITCGIPATGKQYTLTIRRHEKPTPQELHAAAKRRVAELEAEVARLDAITRAGDAAGRDA